MVVDSASHAFGVAGESMAANAHFPNFVHFSNKIIKSITFLLINGKRIQKISSAHLLLIKPAFLSLAVKAIIRGIIDVLPCCEFGSYVPVVVLMLIVYQFVYFFGLYIVLL
jgi:hypothetical protein